jgi:cobalt/nickel transport system ATP-binding protein
MTEIVKVNCLKHQYPDKTKVELCGLEFVVSEGERVAILGPNGAGKTTLLMHILGLLNPLEGTVNVFGMEPHKNFAAIRGKIGVVFQNVDEQIIGPTVYDDIAFSLRNAKIPKGEIDDRVTKIATTLGISDLLKKIPHYLSGGQKKKVALAGALVTEPKLLILDEPFDNLDTKSKGEMVELLKEINLKNRTSLILTTHDINIVPDIAQTLYIIFDGHIKARGTTRDILCCHYLLTQAGLNPPILVDLFLKLKNNGYNVQIPCTINEAYMELEKILKGGEAIG